MNNYTRLIKDFFNKGHSRTIEAKKNIFNSLLVKIASVVINLALVPITLEYVNPDQYGIWLTLSSIIAWFTFFDIGFGNGLRNKFTEAQSTGNFEDARFYISTTYASLTIIFSIVWFVFIITNTFLDWSIILNAPKSMQSELSILAIIVFSFFCIQIVINLISTILTADQKPAKSSFLKMIGQLISLIIIYILTKTSNGSLIFLALSLGFAPILVMILASLVLFSTNYKHYRPSIKYVRYSYAKDIIKLGIKFFVIQIAVVVIYQTNNLIIANVGTPKDVTIFNISFKYLNLSLMIFTIIIMPFWSSFTDAFAKQDYFWMKSTVKTLRYISYFFILLIIPLVFISEYIYTLWIGDQIKIPFSVSVAVGFYVMLLIIVSLNTQILNGIGKIKIQLITYSVATLFHIPLALYLGKMFGITGVLMSGTFFYVIIALFSIKQVNLIMKNDAHGIWDE